MKRYLLDTNAGADFIEKRGKMPDRAREARRKGGRIGIAIPVLAELYYGVEFSSFRDKNLKRLKKAQAGLTIWPFDEKAAAEFGRIRAELRRLGRPMQVLDIMIAAIAFSLGNCTVVSSDSDLSAVPGLAVENWQVSRKRKPALRESEFEKAVRAASSSPGKRTAAGATGLIRK